MAPKTERVEARLTPHEREQIERAARFEGQSLSSFMVDAATSRAQDVLTRQTVTAVPADYFDRLIEALDEPEAAPALEEAARKARSHGRIA